MFQSENHNRPQCGLRLRFWLSAVTYGFAAAYWQITGSDSKATKKRGLIIYISALNMGVGLTLWWEHGKLCCFIFL
jgi:hypothetical protein